MHNHTKGATIFKNLWHVLFRSRRVFSYLIDYASINIQLISLISFAEKICLSHLVSFCPSCLNRLWIAFSYNCSTVSSPLEETNFIESSFKFQSCQASPRRGKLEVGMLSYIFLSKISFVMQLRYTWPHSSPTITTHNI